MALPIKANDTQEGCNPIASNCVIWQGPDIPCIKLCKGDTVSDVTAKLAERLCIILEYLDVSAYDLTCFNPICPSPKDFQELIQLLIDRICALYEIPATSGGGTGCPDCEVPVAQCLQRPDALGNITATLQLRDYVILIANEICGILTTISSIESRVTSLESAVTNIQNNCCNGSGSDLTMPASLCVGTGAGTPVISYLVALDAAFCALQSSSGSQNDTNTALSYKCVAGTDSTTSGTPATYAQIPGWIESPTNLPQSVQYLWLIVCNQNEAIANLQAQLTACCDGGTSGCDVINWGIQKGDVTVVSGNYFIRPTFTGTIPAGWTYPPGITTGTITVTDNAGSTYTQQSDVLNWIQNPSSIPTAAIAIGNPLSASSTHFTVNISISLVNGASTTPCTSSASVIVVNNLWCSNMLNWQGYIIDDGNDKPPRVTLGVGTPVFTSTIPTTYTVIITPIVDGTACGTVAPLTGIYANWQGALNNLPLPQGTWNYGSPAPPSQEFTDPGLVANNCIDGGTVVILIQQGSNPQITCTATMPLVEI